jgi:hypothetical protein
MCDASTWANQTVVVRADHYRAEQLKVTQDQYNDWLAGKPAPEVDQAMIRETDDKRRLAALSR